MERQQWRRGEIQPKHAPSQVSLYAFSLPSHFQGKPLLSLSRTCLLAPELWSSFQWQRKKLPILGMPNIRRLNQASVSLKAWLIREFFPTEDLRYIQGQENLLCLSNTLNYVGYALTRPCEKKFSRTWLSYGFTAVRDTMTNVTLVKTNISLGLAYTFRDSVHYHHGEKHGSLQADVVLCCARGAKNSTSWFDVNQEGTLFHTGNTVITGGDFKAYLLSDTLPPVRPHPLQQGHTS